MNKKIITAAVVASCIAGSSCSNPASENQRAESELKCEVAIDTIVRVGEGLIWDYQFHRLLWIDTQGSLFIHTPQDGKNREIKLDKMIGTVVPYQENVVIVGLEDGIYELNLLTEKRTLIADPEGRIEGNRYNDGKCDAAGRLWIGTMDGNVAEDKAGFYCVEGTQSKTALKNVTISNGVTWSLDNKKMYYHDSPTAKITQFDFDLQSGSISNRKEIITLPEGFGTPDGNTLDEEGMLWVANWGAACVTRWNPQTGELLQKIDVPALNVAAVAFGGEDLDELYIATASLFMPEDQAGNYPEAGKLFKVKPGVKGTRCFYFVK